MARTKCASQKDVMKLRSIKQGYVESVGLISVLCAVVVLFLLVSFAMIQSVLNVSLSKRKGIDES